MESEEHADSCRSCGKCWLSHSGAVSLQHHQGFWPGLLQISSSRVQKMLCVCIPTWQTAMNFTTEMLISFFPAGLVEAVSRAESSKAVQSCSGFFNLLASENSMFAFLGNSLVQNTY